jgi:hypothetical protein
MSSLREIRKLIEAQVEPPVKDGTKILLKGDTWGRVKKVKGKYLILSPFSEHERYPSLRQRDGYCWEFTSNSSDLVYDGMPKSTVWVIIMYRLASGELVTPKNSHHAMIPTTTGASARSKV